mgnify:CR=1 FL=1
MAKKARKPIRKPKKKGISKKKKSGNIITRIIVVIFVLLLAFFLIFSVFKPSKNDKPTQEPASSIVGTNDKKETKPEQKSEKVAKDDNKTVVKDIRDTKQAKKEEATIEQADKKAAETKAVERSIKGTWQSTTGGAFLTMDGRGYRLDFMGVDSDKPIIGTYIVEGDQITFVNKEDPCKDVKGLYEVRFNKHEIVFKCKSDDCTKRHATLPTEWEWLDVEE